MNSARMPFHEVLAILLGTADITKLSPMAIVRYFAENTVIPAGHKEIYEAAEGHKAIVPCADGQSIDDLCVISSSACNERNRVATEAAEKANQVTDADKLKELMIVVGFATIGAMSVSTGLAAAIQKYANAIKDATKPEDFQSALAGYNASIEKLKQQASV